VVFRVQASDLPCLPHQFSSALLTRGTGKTSLARAVAAGINQKHAQQAGPESIEPVAMAVPMDGFHLTRAQLSAMPDPVRAHARRGAEFTFDGAAFLALVESLRAPVEATSVAVLAPSFDHAVKDPVADAIAIGSRQRVVLFEGNYVCLDKDPWRTASDAQHMDERWFVDVDFVVARTRLIKRHVAAGIATDTEAAAARADENDLVNGAEIVAGKVATIDETIVSREDASWS
jgi:pantothenate kinase